MVAKAPTLRRSQALAPCLEKHNTTPETMTARPFRDRPYLRRHDTTPAKHHNGIYSVRTPGLQVFGPVFTPPFFMPKNFSQTMCSDTE